MPPRKRTAPVRFQAYFPARKTAKLIFASKGTTEPFIYLAVKTDDDPDGFYLTQAHESEYQKDGELPIRWLTKLSPRGDVYRLDYKDKVHGKMVVGQVDVIPLGNSKFRLPAKERARIMSESDEEGEAQEPSKTKYKSAKVDNNGKTKTTKRRVWKNGVDPNDELLPNENVNQFPKGDDGFLASVAPSTGNNFVSDFVASKLLIRAVIRGDVKMVERLVNDPAKCPSLLVPRSVDIPMDALTMALVAGNAKIIKILADEIYSKKPKPRPTLQMPRLSTVSSGTYNVRSLNVPVIRDVMMSRGGQEGSNALTQDQDHYGQDKLPHYEDVIYEHGVPLESVDVLTKAIREATGEEGVAMSYRSSRPPALKSSASKIDCAMIHGHWQLAGRLLVASKSCPDFCQVNNLHVAALTKTNLDGISAIRGCSVTKKAIYRLNISPLHCAAINPNPQFLQEFLLVSPEYNICDKRGRRPVHYAAACQTPAPLKLLLDSGVSYLDPDFLGRTPLIYASIASRSENVKLLLKQGEKDRLAANATQATIGKYGPCAINKLARDAKGALHHAASNNHFEVCKILLENGADVDAKGGSDKLTPLMMASTCGHLKIVKLLIEQGKGLVERRDKKLRTALTFAVKNGNSHVTAYLLHLGADSNGADSSGNRLIHYAAAYGWLDCVKLLISAGADSNVENDWTMTPLAVSFLKGHFGITRELLKQPGADVNFSDKNGNTMVMLTCASPLTHGLFRQLKFLVEEVKADVSLEQENGCNALHLLARSADSFLQPRSDPVELRCRMAALLLDAGCSPAHENANNQTPVNTAIGCQRLKLAELLLSRGGVISTKSDPVTLENVLHAVVAYGGLGHSDCLEILDLVKQHVDSAGVGQMINAGDRDGCTPLVLAAYNYSIRRPTGEKDSAIYNAWLNRARTLLEKLIEDFGATCPDDEEEDEVIEENDGPKKYYSTFAHLLVVPDIAPPAVEFVRKYRPALNTYNSRGETPAHTAAKDGRFDSLRLLIDCGANMNLPTRKTAHYVNLTPLLFAASNWRIDVVKFLIENSEAAKIDLSVTNPMTGDSIASVLCDRSSLDVGQRLQCLELLAAKTSPHFDPNFKNKEGRSLLCLAIGANSRQVDTSNVVEQFLLAQGADCWRVKDLKGRTALHWLFLSAKDSEACPKLISETLDPVDLLSMMLARLSDTVDVKDLMDRTPLHYAAACGAPICCLRLLAQGASIEATDKNGDTSLSLAIRFARQSAALILLQAKPNLQVTVSNSPGSFFASSKTPPVRRTTIEWRQTEVVRLGCKIGHSSRVDLLLAVIKLHWQGLASLLIDVSIEKDQSAWFRLIASSLTSAAYNFTLTLLEKTGKESKEARNAIRTTTNSFGRGLFSILALGATKWTGASADLVTKVATQIADLGCDPNAKDIHGCTALHYACLNQYKPLVEYLAGKTCRALTPTKDLTDNFGRSPIHALFWNMTDSEAADRIQEILPIITPLDGQMDLPVNFAPLQHSIPPSSKKCEFCRADYFGQYKDTPATTCLIRSVESSFFTLTAAALAGGANPNVRSADGRTPLMAAVAANSIECFYVLLSENTQKVVLSSADPSDPQIKEIRLHKGYSADPYPDPYELNSVFQASLPNNERDGLDFLATESTTGNNVLHIANTSRYRNTVETRYMASALANIEEVLTLMKNKANQTPSELSEAMQTVPPSLVCPLRPSSTVDLDEMSKNWIEEMEAKLAKEKHQQIADDDLEPDQHVSSHMPSKIVCDPDNNQRPFNALMTKIDLHRGGCSEFNFYQLQLVQMEDTSLYVVFTRWGRIGDDGMYQQTPFKLFKDAQAEFCKIFKEKTGNEWQNLTGGFTKIPKKYFPVKLERPDRFSRLTSVKINLNLDVKPTLMGKDEFVAMKSMVEAALGNFNDGTFFGQLDQLHLTPFGLIAPESLQAALRVLNELKEVVQEIQRKRYTRDWVSEDDESPELLEFLALHEKAVRLSVEYYHLIPRTGFAYCEVYPLAENAAVQSELRQVDLLLNLQAVARLLIAAERNVEQNPCDFILSCLGFAVHALDPESEEAQEILQYISATWQPTESGTGGIEVIFKLDRLCDSEQPSFLKLGNRRMLWLGTQLRNLLSIFASHGLMANLEQSAGTSIRLSDAFDKSMQNCDSPYNNQPSFMLLCDVALGQCSYANFGTPPSTADTLITWTEQCPDPRFSVTTRDNSTMPCGGHINSTSRYHYCLNRNNTNYADFIVKDSKQISIKYLVKFWQNQ